MLQSQVSVTRKRQTRSFLTSPKCQLSGLDVLHAHALPVEEIAQALGTVTLVDTLASALGGELVHVFGELVHTVIDTLHPSVDNVDTVILRVLNQLLHVATESGKVSGDGWDTHDGTFGGSVTPWFVVGSKDTQVGTTDEIVVIHRKNWVTGAQELGVEDDLDAIRRVVEELAPADLVENGIFAVVDHVVSDDWWEAGALHGKQTTTKQDLVLARQQTSLVWRILTLGPLQ